jgi:hypothetical protein
VKIVMAIALIALIVFLVDVTLQGVYACMAILTDRWYERRPSAYVPAPYKPPRTARLLGALLAINVTLALCYAAGTPLVAFPDTLLALLSGP